MPIDALRRRTAVGRKIARSSERHAENLEGAAPLAPGRIVAQRHAAGLRGICEGERAHHDQAIRVG